ncbi:MAG TPA: hypothetical protein VLP43_01570 [Solirubrobacteraceae bacterium]|nr:hypothetical protein [Solirubrobacteraceae bacterium]
MRPAPITATLSAAGLILGYGVAVLSGSRPLGGVVLAAFAAACVVIWLRRDGGRITGWLTLCGVVAFAASHVLGRLIGAWAAVVLVAAVMAGLCWQLSDRRHRPGRLGHPAAAD